MLGVLNHFILPLQRRPRRQSSSSDVTNEGTNLTDSAIIGHESLDSVTKKLRESLSKLRGDLGPTNSIVSRDSPLNHYSPPNPRTSTPADDTNQDKEELPTQQRGRISQSETGTRRSRSLSRDKSGETSVRLGTIFRLHTEERARRRRRYSTQDHSGYVCVISTCTSGYI